MREAQKRRKLLEGNKSTRNLNQDQDQNMEVDEETMQEAGQGETPTAANRGQWYKESPGRHDASARQDKNNGGKKEMVITVEVDEKVNAKTLARVLTVAEKPIIGKGPKDTKDPFDKYTDGPMPLIYDEDPATLLARIDPVQISS